MVTIEIGNIQSKLYGASAQAVFSIDEVLSTEVSGASFTDKYRQGIWDGKRHFFSVVTKKFPTGLLYKVCKILKSLNIEYSMKDCRTLPNTNIFVPENMQLGHETLGHITLRDYQQEAVERAIANTRGIINVATNGGKTEIACGIIKCLLPHLPEGMCINFFTHSSEILTQSRARLSERLGMEIGIIGGMKWEPRQVNVVMIPTLSRYLKKPKDLPNSQKRTKLREAAKAVALNSPAYKEACAAIKEYEAEQWAALNGKIKRTKGFLDTTFCFICDEAHHSSSSTWYDTFMKLDNAPYRFGLTGTIDMDAEDKTNILRLVGCTGFILSKITNKYLIEHGYSATPVIVMMRTKSPMIYNSLYEDVRVRGIINNKSRNQMFCEKILERAESGKQCLIIVNETEHGDILLDMLGRMCNDSIDMAFIHGDRTIKYRTQCLNELRAGIIRILIATSILDEGVDVPGINSLFLASGGKSMRMVLQRIGRGLRKKDDGSSLEVYDSVDANNEFLLDHTHTRLRIYEREGFKVTYE